MRNSVTSVLVIAPLLFLSSSPRAEDTDLASLAWLAGCWASESGEAGSGEQWTPLAGGTMLGVGRTIKNGKTVEYEFLQIRKNMEGKVVYVALPSGQKETTFTATSVAERSVTFENLQHDFPQSIVYRLLSGDRLVVRIEGIQNGNLRGVDFPMKRVSCGSFGVE
jgi:hypothetical protein